MPTACVSMPNGWDGDWRQAPGPSHQWNGGRFRRVGGRIVLLVGRVLMAGPGSRLIGSTFPGAQSLMILSQTGAARPAAGVIHSRELEAPGLLSLFVSFRGSTRRIARARHRIFPVHCADATLQRCSDPRRRGVLSAYCERPDMNRAQYRLSPRQ